MSKVQDNTTRNIIELFCICQDSIPFFKSPKIDYFSIVLNICIKTYKNSRSNYRSNSAQIMFFMNLSKIENLAF